MILLAVTAVLAAELTVERVPSKLESTEPAAPKGSYNDAEQEAYTKRLDAWKRAVDAVKRTDGALRRELPAIASCYGAAGDVTMTVTVAESGTVSRVTTTKDGVGRDATLVKCLADGLKGQQVAAFTTSGDVEVTWKVHFEPPASPPSPSPIERDLGIGDVPFGGASTDLGSVMQSGTSDYDTTYIRELDKEAKWFGVELSRASYLFDKKDHMFAAIFEVKGDTSAFNLRTALKSRYGQPKWEPNVRAWYWRGSSVLIIAQDLTAEPGLAVSVFDHVRAKTDVGITGLPGDAVDPAQSSTRLPAIFKR